MANNEQRLQHVKNVVKTILQHFSECCRMRCCEKCQTFNNFQLTLSSMLLNIQLITFEKCSQNM
jgi:hypothetical protein